MQAWRRNSPTGTAVAFVERAQAEAKARSASGKKPGRFDIHACFGLPDTASQVQAAPKRAPAATPDTNPLTAHRDALLARLDRDGPTLFTEEWLNRARQALRYMVPWTQAAGALGTGARRCHEVGGGEAPSR